MGALFSSCAEVKEPSTDSAKVLPETQKDVDGKIMIRHRPTCLSTDIERGVTEVPENLVQPATKSP